MKNSWNFVYNQVAKRKTPFISTIFCLQIKFNNLNFGAKIQTWKRSYASLAPPKCCKSETIFERFSNTVCFVSLYDLSLGRLSSFLSSSFMKIWSTSTLSRCISWQTHYSCLHGVWKPQKKSHSSLRAKRATFTFWVDKSLSIMPKMIILASFWKPEACGQTVLPDM